MISSSERALLFLFQTFSTTFDIFSSLQVCALIFFNIFTAMWRSLIFEWISYAGWSKTHLTKSTKIPPTKITRPIKGTILEIDEAVNTTELITFMSSFCFFFLFSTLIIEYFIRLFLFSLSSKHYLFHHFACVSETFRITNETGFVHKRSLLFSIAKSKMSWWC